MERSCRRGLFDVPPITAHPCFVWSPQAVAGYDAALICTDHDCVDYAELVASSALVVDTRNATRAAADPRGAIVKA
jgi:UDP-N-acetyl-D-glucosamine dehydrogenase